MTSGQKIALMLLILSLCLAFVACGSTSAIRLDPTPQSGTLAINTPQLPNGGNGTVGVTYSGTLTATGGTLPYTWSVSSGTLPAGVALSTSGSFAGTPTAAGTYTFAIKVSDNGGQNATQSFSVTITQASANLAIVTASLPNGSVGSSYSGAVVVGGGSTPYTWSLASGSLPVGLTLSSTTGSISGTPSSAGTSNFTVKVSDAGGQSASRTFAVVVTSASALAITTTSLPGASLSANYSANIAVAGGASPYAWSIASGSLPTGLTLSSSTGSITGMARAVGTFSFTVKVMDSSAATASQAYSIGVAAGNGGGPAPGASDTIVFQDDFESGNLNKWDSVDVRYSISSNSKTGQDSVQGNIPAGAASGEMDKWFLPGYDELYVRFDAQFSAGFLNGAGGNGLHWVSLMGNDVNNQYSASGKAGIKPTGADFFLTDPLPETAAQTGSQSVLPMEFYSQWPEMSCPSDYNPTSNQDCYGNPIVQTAPKTNANDGQWHTYVFHVKANSIGAHDGLQEMWIDGQKVIAQTGMLWRTATNLHWNEFALQLYVNNTPQTETNWFDNVVIWTPAGSGVPQPLAITTGSVPAATVGSAYSTTLAASGGTAPYSWSISSGALPAGLSLNSSTGAISGTPSSAGPASFTAQVSDSVNATATQSYTMTVNGTPTLSITTSTLPAGNVGSGYSATLSASGGTGPYTWSLSTGTLPFGLSLNSSTGVISGSPTTAGTANFTAKVVDTANASASQSYALLISSTSSGTVFWADDFETDSGFGDPPNAWFDSSGSASFVTSGCQSGSRCVQISSIGAGSNLIWRCFSCSAPLPGEYWTSHWIRLSAGWTWNSSQSFKWVYNRTGKVGGTCYFDGQGEVSGIPSSNPVTIDSTCDTPGSLDGALHITADTNWHHLEQHINAQSVYEIWWDGTLVGSTAGAVGAGSNFVDFGIGVYLNGTSAPANETMWLDNVKICTGGRCP